MSPQIFSGSCSSPTSKRSSPTSSSASGSTKRGTGASSARTRRPSWATGPMFAGSRPRPPLTPPRTSLSSTRPRSRRSSGGRGLLVAWRTLRWCTRGFSFTESTTASTTSLCSSGRSTTTGCSPASQPATSAPSSGTTRRTTAGRHSTMCGFRARTWLCATWPSIGRATTAPQTPTPRCSTCRCSRSAR
eukprot:Amastigsp_a8515_6.p3 type:complete len:189 gc:universal Amastigsp_a8515_6:587-21(-)